MPYSHPNAPHDLVNRNHCDASVISLFRPKARKGSPRMVHYHFSIQQRYIITKQRHNGMIYREIGKLIDRCHTAISREVRFLRKLYNCEYNPKAAQNVNLIVNSTNMPCNNFIDCTIKSEPIFMQ